MVGCLNKSDASEGFNQVIDFLNGSYIKYALTINPNIYASCIKQFWNTVTIKQDTDVTRLHALVDKKKTVIFEDAICEILRLDDAEGMVCLPNEEIFAESPLFENMLQVRKVDAEEEFQDEENVFNQGRISVDIDEGIELVDDQQKDVQVKGRQADTQEKIYNIDLDHTSKVLSMQEDSEVQEVVKVVNAAKLITEVVTAATTTQVIPAAEPVVAAVTIPISAAKPKGL
nr:hypothetical protein [Tanacetum cinerariifolium]